MIYSRKTIIPFLVILSCILFCCEEEGGDEVAAPAAGFEASATSVVIGESVGFSDLSTGDIESWSWSFEGGTPAASTEQNPTVTYSSAGAFQVSLTVFNDAGQDTEVKTSYIEVVPEVAADFNADVTEVKEGGEVAFSDLSSGSPTSWSWTFEGGEPATSTEQNPVVTYSTAGIYSVTLEISNGLSTNSKTKEAFITVTETYPTIGTEAAAIDSLEEAGVELFEFLRLAYTFDGVLTNQISLNGNWQDISDYDFNATNPAIAQLWQDGYHLIYKVNNIIESAPDVTGDEKANSLIAQSRLIRAIVYHELLNYFGGVPAEHTHVPSSNMMRNSSQEVSAFIKEDLDGAIALLPSASGSNELGYFSDLAVGVKLRQALFEKDWISVSTISDKLIGSGNYVLDATVEAIYTDGNAEVFLGFEKGTDADFNAYFSLGDFVPVFRYTEVYLAAAEAEVHLGNSTDAVSKLNILRERRGQAPLSQGSSDEMLESIFSQWQDEMHQDGVFFELLKRFGKAEEELMIQTFQTLLPIPQQVIDNNFNMVQNPGY